MKKEIVPPGEQCADAGPCPRSPRKLTIELGWSAKPFAEQLASQGLVFDQDTIHHLHLDMQAASRLKTRGVIGYAAGERLYDKIAKAVWKEVARCEAARATGPRVAAQVDREGSREANSHSPNTPA